ncbi:MAG: retropepsin-like aspartic protease [Ketobacteraceae bacterium]|nr:retropepsin-like aspartic protease [Ketobacteraceae bacterium]
MAFFVMGAPQVGASSDGVAVPTEVIELQEKGTDVFYLSAKMGVKANVELMLDTGSGYLAINEALLDELKDGGMATYQRSIRARLANGSVKKVPVYRISQLTLGKGCIIHNVDAAVLRGKTRNILGLNVLKQMESFSVSFNPPRLVLNGCQAAGQLVSVTAQ